MNAILQMLRPAWLITRREVRDQFRDWRIIFPILGLTVFFPFLMNFTAQQALNFVRKYGANLIGERMVPFLLMIVGFFPISVSLVIALDTFVGEKERGSIEPLLSTPVKDWQLYLGKLAAATVPPLFSSFIGMAVYLIGLASSRVPIPAGDMLAQIISLTIIQAFVMVCGAVVVSSQATSVRAANLLSSFIIIPSAFLIQGEALLMFWGNNQTLWWTVFGLAVLGVLLVRVGLAHFQREELLGREIDVLNFRWGFGVFVRAFTGEAKNLKTWFTQEIPATLKRLGVPMMLVSAFVVIGFFLGARQVERFMAPLDTSGLSTIKDQFNLLIQNSSFYSIQSVMEIWWQNSRVLIISMLLGIFSFGVLGVIPLIASMGITGYLFNLLLVNKIAPWYYLLSFLLPHGVFEIPAVVIAGAAILRMGAILATPNTEKTVGEVWLNGLGEWCKVMVGIVLPLLLVAAAVESWITPRLVIYFFGK